jgi:hypothetical protein
MVFLDRSKEKKQVDLFDGLFSSTNFSLSAEYKKERSTVVE